MSGPAGQEGIRMTVRNLAIWGVVIAVLIALYTVIYPGSKTQTSNEISYSQILQNCLLYTSPSPRD